MEILSQTTQMDSETVTAICRSCGREFEKCKVLGTLAKYQTECPECVEREIFGDSAAILANASAKRASDWQKTFESICPPLYRDTDPKRINSEKLSQVLAWECQSKGLVIHGESGKGKTRAMWLLVRQLLAQGKSVRVFDCLDFELECSDRFARGEGKNWVKALLSYDVICFDDLGKFRLTDRVESVLFGLWEKQIANLKPIIATTNDTGATIENRMTENRGAPLVRRIKEFCTCIPF